MTLNILNLFTSGTRTQTHTICNTPAETVSANLIVKSRSESGQPCDALWRAWTCNLNKRSLSQNVIGILHVPFSMSVLFYFGFQVGCLSTTELKQQADLDAQTGLVADGFYFTSFPFNFWMNQHLCSEYVAIARDAFCSHNRYEM